MQPSGPGRHSCTGIDLRQFNRMSGGFTFLAGRPVSDGPDDIIMDQLLRRAEEASMPASTIDLLNRTGTCRASSRAASWRASCLPLQRLQDLTGNTGKISQIYLKVDEPANIQPVIDNLKTKLEGLPDLFDGGVHLAVQRQQHRRPARIHQRDHGDRRGDRFRRRCLSMYMAVLQRTREIGILKSLGASHGSFCGSS